MNDSKLDLDLRGLCMSMCTLSSFIRGKKKTSQCAMWMNVCAYLSYFLFQHFLIVELQLLPLISSTPALTTVWKRVESKLSIHSLHLFYDGALPRFSSTCERNTKQTGLKNTLMHSFHLQTGNQAHSQCFFLRLVRVLVLMPTLQCVCACVCVRSLYFQ